MFSSIKGPHDPEFAIICVSPLGENENPGPYAKSKGHDYWVTLRAAGDRLSSDFILIGMCRQGEVTKDDLGTKYNVLGIYGQLPDEVKEHVEKCLEKAYESYAVNDDYMAELEAEEISTIGMYEQWLKFLPGHFATILDGYHGARFFICQSRGELKALRRKQK